ncbi:MAG: BolA family transcriptional regulator [Candidatus Manganitrophus sp.]|uniref:BolA family transcriptional regulator n=2 Tax=Candidatus Manganitrophus noduliformans TaxID=2606439 RepID=A0A7X6DLD0_9BACT|nr:BolA family transcriptional regulator [Candidatus Manganitrophus sp.]NKE69287.1 BolA family transcriptional regulator [Candidatus Manganitrophus noduliformans]MDC4224306.1 BolA family transcriptional regulator [Candidatus Manganitrophus sp.]WDT70411.1 MAG: BolA family transcriptional regulator [Candidatus Manganitrophus sp.]WDT77326.1 MAG: BolA family transcriptional regulator [Candidatus Manganitrophus sp.]
MRYNLLSVRNSSHSRCTESKQMISQEMLISYIKKAMPDALVTVVDRTGTMDHYRLQIISEAFRGKNLLDRQRFVYQALDEPMKDGRIHALEIKSYTHEEAPA